MQWNIDTILPIKIKYLQMNKISPINKIKGAIQK